MNNMAELTEVQKLKARVHQLSCQNIQLQFQIAQVQLNEERRALETEFDVLGKFDWDKLEPIEQKLELVEKKA